MEFTILDTKEATTKQLLHAIHENVKKAHILSSEVEQLRKIASIPKTQSQELTTAKEDNIKLPQKKIDESFEEEVSRYYSVIKNLSPEELSEQAPHLLPTKNNYQCERILYRLEAEFARNIKEIREFISTEKLTDQEIGGLEEEILGEQEKIDIINTFLISRNKSIIQDPTTQVENNLIFVPTTGGNIRVLEELDHIVPEYYQRFQKLFESIKKGQFKNLVRHTNNIELDGLLMVKGFKVRVVFTRLNENSYAIISAFTKKSDDDKTTRTTLVSKYMDYKKIANRLTRNLDNEEFIALHKDYESILFQKLSPEREIPAVKKKVGDN